MRHRIHAKLNYHTYGKVIHIPWCTRYGYNTRFGYCQGYTGLHSPKWIMTDIIEEVNCGHCLAKMAEWDKRNIVPYPMGDIT